MSFASDLKVLYHLTLSPIRGKTHAERLESFYGAQSGAYDDFRKRLLKGRQELFESLEIPQGGVWMDFGAGTGSNAEWFGPRLNQLGKGYLVDLSGSLLGVAKQRIAERGWTNLETLEADATTVSVPEGQIDLATFSYSLTMIPDWFAAIDRAYELLKPGGQIGIVDFYVSRKYPREGAARHGWFTRNFWPTWFGSDNVFPNADHLPYLERKFELVSLVEAKAKVPYMPFFRVPIYRFVGRKRA
jgi:S-adenosylmethionine-diacylgycerolhomoserine-N-methlytransferase